MFFLNDTATTEIYPLSLHDALPIYRLARLLRVRLQGWRLPLAVAVFVFLSSWLVMGLVEPAGSGITDAGTYWWDFLVTAATVGYGDVFTVSAGGPLVRDYRNVRRLHQPLLPF